MNKKQTVIAVLSLIFLSGALGTYYFVQLRSSSSSLRVGVVTWPGHGPCFVAKDKGFFQGLNVECRIMDDTRAKRAAFIAGDLDVYGTTIDTFAIEAATGVAGKLIFLTDESFGGDAVVSKPDVTSTAQLRGKRVAYAESTPSHFFLLYLLKKDGLTTKDVTPVVVDDPSTAGKAFMAGQVDAAVTWEPFVSQATADGRGKILVSSRDAEGLIVASFIASNSALLHRQADLKKFADGWFRAVDYIALHPDEAYPIMAKGLNLPPDDVAGMMGGLRLFNKSRNASYLNLNGSGPSQIEILFETAGELWKGQGLIRESVPSSSVIDRQRIKELLPK